VAIMFLQKQGVPSIDVARALFRQVGGLPLTLGLAARVSRDESSNAGQIAGLTTRSFLLFSASEAAVQGQLYDRILLRIRDEDVRAIAHPGLVVRRITTDVIRGVLAVPCGLGEISLERAQALYDGLRRQAGLISSGSDGALRHQPDIREAMLKLIARDRPAQVQAIHEAALAFYEHRDDPVSKAEWVFHALKLGVTRELIDRRWTPQVADSIVGSFDELPPRGQVYVSLKTGRPLSAELRKVADTEEWEIEIERKAREALRQGSIDKAAKLVSERTDRSPASGLYAVDAIVAMRQKDFERADAVLARGIDGTRLAGLTDRLIELLRLQGESWASRGRQEEAAAALLEAQDLASRTGLPSLALQVLADRVRGDRKPGVAEVEDVVRATPDSDFASLQVHLRGLFQAYGTASDLLLRKGLGAFVVNRDVVLDAAPALATQIEWDQNTRVNRRLLDRLASHGDDPGLRLELSRVLESALDPRRAQRAR